MWIPRTIQSLLAEVAATRPALILTGCRQAGKTCLLQRCFPEYRYVSLDLPSVAETAELAGEEFLARWPPPLILDEVQYSPSILRHIKADIDRHRDQNGRFLITGSQRFPLMEGVTESLAGRCSVVELHPLSAQEVADWSGRPLDQAVLLEEIWRGSYPEVQARGLAPERFYGDYLATYLERDVRTALNVRNLRDFERFIRLCASRTAQLLSYSSLSGDVGVSSATVKSWLSVLEASGIIYLLEPYHRNLGKRIVKSPKLYFLDTGLACYLNGFRRSGDLAGSAMLGSLFETHALGQLVRHFANRGRRPPLFFYRDHQGHEVDFLIQEGEKVRLLECKWAEMPSRDHRGLNELHRLLGPGRIHSSTILTPAPGRRTLPGGIQIADTVDLDFLDG